MDRPIQRVEGGLPLDPRPRVRAEVRPREERGPEEFERELARESSDEPAPREAPQPEPPAAATEGREIGPSEEDEPGHRVDLTA